MEREGLAVDAKVAHDATARGEAGAIQRGGGRYFTIVCPSDFFHSPADRWPDAVNNARTAATEAPTDEQAMYWQCFLWLAQIHTGTPEPLLVKRRVSDAWPAPILESLQGKISEAELVEAVEDEHDPGRRRDILSEALFYTGQARLAANHTDEAVKYFTATVNLKVLYFIEQGYDTKHLHRPIVTSATYRQASRTRSEEESIAEIADHQAPT